MIGHQIQNYQIKAHLGEGGMGSVYLASDTFLDRLVALKILHSSLTSQAQLLERFKKEARVLAQLVHPNIAGIYNFIEQTGNYFMVMEYVEGQNLDQILRQQAKLPYHLVIPIFIQVLEGLNYAHNKGIFHRDIKPSNIILDAGGTVKLMDFGIAVMAGEQRLTQVNKLVGTIEYLAPELIQGKEPSKASDLFSIGVTMYELLTGSLPFEGSTDFNIMQNIIRQSPVSVDKLDTTIPKPFAKIISRLLEKNPQNRFATAKELKQELIATFPHLSNYDLSAKLACQLVPATRIISNDLSMFDSLKPTELHLPATNIFNKAFYSLISRWNNKLTSLQQKWILISVLLLVVFIGSFALLLAGKRENKVEAISTINNKAKTQPVQSKDQIIISSPPVENSVNDNQEQKVFTPIPVSVEKPENHKEKPIEKKRKEQVVNTTKQQDKILQPEKKDSLKTTTPPESAETKYVKLTTKVPVPLYLIKPIDPATAFEGQELRFMAISDIIYNGRTIIKKGAIATANIKTITKRKISIHFKTIISTNGQTLTFYPPSSLFKEITPYRIEELPTRREFSADLNRGVTISF